MAKPNKPQSKTTNTTSSPPRPMPNVTKKTPPSVFGTRNDTLFFGRENYKWMLIGIGIMAVGFICMAGGNMPSPDVWDESLIYSPLRTVVAPFLILAGLGVEIYALFKKSV